MKRLTRMILPVLVLVLSATSSLAQEQQVRVATYNIKFLSTNVSNQGDRLAKLKQVIELLGADVIGLQEIADRDSLKLLFPPQDWNIIIDDDSGDNQDVAVVVRKPLTVIGFDASLDADDQHFLFPGAANNSHFPNRRDLLFVEVGLPNSADTFFVMVHHAKARSGGRTNTDPRREGAGREVVEVLKERFDDRKFILLGDFNDNPDDRSLNIMETGHPDAPGGPEEIDGPLLVNLAEPLCAAGHVSWGRNSGDIVGDRVNTIDPQSRHRNNDQRGTTQDSIFDILFDQLLIPGWMKNRFVPGSAKVFDNEVAMRGNDSNRASDHLPVLLTLFSAWTNLCPTATASESCRCYQIPKARTPVVSKSPSATSRKVQSTWLAGNSKTKPAINSRFQVRLRQGGG